MSPSRVDTETRGEIVREYLAGDTVTALAKRYAVSKPTIYAWIRAANGTSRGSHGQRLTDLEARVAALELAGKN